MDPRLPTSRRPRRHATRPHRRRTSSPTDLPALIQTARAAGLYVNLITSGQPLDERRLDELIAAGLDHFQLSFQGARENIANEISGTKSHAQKLRVLDWLKTRRVGVTLNFVVHRKNLDQLEEMLAIAENSSATRIEFAHVQTKISISSKKCLPSLKTPPPPA